MAIAQALAIAGGTKAIKNVNWTKFSENLYQNKAMESMRRHRTGGKIRLTKGQKGYMQTGGFYGKYNGTPGKELKFLDISTNLSPIPAGTTLFLNSVHKIAQDTTENGRIGRKCTVKAIHWKFQIRLLENSASQSDDSVRLIMYLDRQCNGASAGVMQIMADSANFQSFYALENQDRFAILYDKMYSINGTGERSLGDKILGRVINGEFNKRCNINVEFNGTTGAITEIRSANVGIMVISENGHCDITSTIRVRFKG